VGETKRKISTTLVDAMEKGRVKYAAQFCNLVAYPIVDSMSKVHHARIRRVSDKPRNPKDAMDEEEQKVFAIFKAKAQMPNAELKPIVVQHDDGTVGYYAPIKISMPTCLKCHGEVGKDIKAEDYKVLKLLYPNDVAVGYKEGELRGMFSIRFSKAH
jgi:cytochrome c